MVYKHKNEWSYDWEKIKSDTEKFIKYHHPDAKQEQINERVNEIKKKYDALYDFWDKLNFKTDTFWYFHPFAWVEQMKRVFSSIKPDIDLRPLMTFEPQKGHTDCNITCKKIINQLGISAEGATQKNAHSYYQIAIENIERTSLIFDDNKLKEGLEYIDASLEKSYPILVGVNHTLGKKTGNEKDVDTTDHYVIIVGRYYENETYYYRFWDVGTKMVKKMTINLH